MFDEQKWYYSIFGWKLLIISGFLHNIYNVSIFHTTGVKNRWFRGLGWFKYKNSGMGLVSVCHSGFIETGKMQDENAYTMGNNLTNAVR